jgi:hypothetical protein
MLTAEDDNLAQSMLPLTTPAVSQLHAMQIFGLSSDREVFG